MRYSTSLSSKGQLTVPIEIRKRLGLKEGDCVEFIAQGELTLIRPARGSTNPFEAYIGALPSFPGGTNEINTWIADMRDDQPAKK